MARQNVRRTPRLEILESRQVLSAGGPSPQAQYMLELVNKARTNPAAIADWTTKNLSKDTVDSLSFYNVDLNAAKAQIASLHAQQPLGWDSKIADAAQAHSQDQATHGFQSHSGSDGSDLNTRLNRSNVAARSSSSENAFAYSESLDQAMQAFLLDWGVPDHGHLRNLLQPDTSGAASFNEVGIGIAQGNKDGTGPLVVTQDFAHVNRTTAQVVGVAYTDPNHTGSFQLNSGVGDVTVTARNVATGQTASTTTWDAGGYQIDLAPGTYDVWATVGGRAVQSQRVSIGSENVKADFVLDATPPPVQQIAAPTPPPQTVVPIPQPPAQAPAQVTAVTVPVKQNTDARSSMEDFSIDWIVSWTWQGKANDPK